MTDSILMRNKHLLWRAGFGPQLGSLNALERMPTKALLRSLISSSAAAPSFLDVADADLKQQYTTAATAMSAMAPRRSQVTDTAVTRAQNKQSSENDRRRFAQKSRENIKQLNLAWLNQMVNSNQQLLEKLSLFWHGHFAANSGNILHQQQLLDTIRKNALGNFGDLLRSVSKSGSMITYLNNNQNRKNRPNENFARELMELFTLGRGNYTENDVKEGARAFTGWGTNPAGDFVFRKQQHDADEKTFLGKTGNFDGGDILDILLQQKQTAIHITTKIYRFYVNEIPNRQKIAKLADGFYNSGYNISKLLQSIFESEWFYEAENIGNRVKSPVELIVGLRRNLELEIRNEQVQLLFQRLLGQLLFYPPNVAGWPGGFNWIDSSSLMLRLQIPKMIVESQEVTLAPKDNDDQMMGMKDPQVEKTKPRKTVRVGGQSIQATVNWKGYLSGFEKTKRESLLAGIAEVLLVTRSDRRKLIDEQFIDTSNRESFIKTATIQLMCTPEYQLC